MATSWVHAEASARKFGGKPEDYIKIHEFIDSSKKAFGDVRHRAFFHNTFGPWICQEIFGVYITVVTKSGKKRRVAVREIAESHIIEDLGCIPSPGDWLNCMECKNWMSGKKNKILSKGEFLDDRKQPPSVS
jgi:hypothetical protein